MSTLIIPSELKNVGALGILIVILLVRPQGILGRASGSAEREGAHMDWDKIIINALEPLIGSETVVFALAAIGLNVHFGYTGLLNFGQAGFLAVAAYGLAVTVATFGLPFWLGILVGLAGAVVLALLLGIPTLRLRADYLAIVTIAAAEIVRLIVRSVTLRGHLRRLRRPAGVRRRLLRPQPLPDGDVRHRPVRLQRAADVGAHRRLDPGRLSCLVVFLLMRSPWGRVLKAIREDEDAVRSLGKNVYSYKMQSLIIGGVLGCLGGFIFALGQAAVQPDIFGTETTFFAYTVLILGGAARVLGPVVGAMIFWCCCR